MPPTAGTVARIGTGKPGLNAEYGLWAIVVGYELTKRGFRYRSPCRHAPGIAFCHPASNQCHQRLGEACCINRGKCGSRMIRYESLWFRSAEGALRTIDGYEAMHPDPEGGDPLAAEG
jgi:hypothetical protein